MANARVARGRRTQVELAARFRQEGWPDATSTVGAETGRDIKGMLGLAPEVKATSSDPILPALRQAAKNAGDDLPFVVWRPNGYGPERMDDWPVAMRLVDFIQLLHEAGYGNAPAVDALAEQVSIGFRAPEAVFADALPCSCSCHTVPGVMHMAPCCNRPPFHVEPSPST